MANMVLESIGCYLPPRAVATADVLRGCKNPIQFPLELLTGIRSRRMAGHQEFSVHLAEKAVIDCLASSRHAPEEIDLLICCNISRYDAPRRVTYEPSTAATIKQRLGLCNALAFDVCNACAGMFTGLLLAETYLKAGWARCALVASGEYITHLTLSAQREIESFMDRRLASLTLGDAGAAVVAELSDAKDAGFERINLFTLSKYHPLCTAKPSEGGQPGTSMVTDSIQSTNVFIERSAMHAYRTLDDAGWPITSCGHVIPHQTSKITIKEGMSEVERLMGMNLESITVCNLEERGNTASNTHFVALKDKIRDRSIQPGDRVIFCVTGAGITVGTALYTFDDLPDRLRNETPAPKPHQAITRAKTRRIDLTVNGQPALRIRSVATARPQATTREARETRRLVASAAETCLAEAQQAREDIGLLLSIGLYRSGFLAEPAGATIAASDLAINDDCSPLAEKKTLALDLQNGPVAFLNACSVAGSMIQTGRCEKVMVVAAETENGGKEPFQACRNLCEMGSAVLLEASTGEGDGFLAMHFRDFPEHIGALQAYASQEGETTEIVCQRVDDLEQRYLACIGETVSELLQAQGLSIDQIQVLCPPQISSSFVEQVAQSLGVGAEKVVDAAQGGLDLFTSSIPVALEHARRQGLAKPGSLALLIATSAGIQVACALYRF